MSIEHQIKEGFDLRLVSAPYRSSFALWLGLEDYDNMRNYLPYQIHLITEFDQSAQNGADLVRLSSIQRIMRLLYD